MLENISVIQEDLKFNLIINKEILQKRNKTVSLNCGSTSLKNIQ